MTDEVVELMKKHGLKFRIDGARIFNAFAALNVLVKENLSEWNETDCFVALQEIVQKLKIDHKNSKTLAVLEQVYFDILKGSHITALKLGKIMDEHGMLLMHEQMMKAEKIDKEKYQERKYAIDPTS